MPLITRMLTSGLALAMAELPSASAQSADKNPAPSDALCGLDAQADIDTGAETRLHVHTATVCETGGVVRAEYRISDDQGEVLFDRVYQADQVMRLAYASDRDSMQESLAAWADLNRYPSSVVLPSWEALNGDQEFPFLLSQEMSEADYKALIASDIPVFCYIQGMESLLCLTYQDGALEELGVQLFPG